MPSDELTDQIISAAMYVAKGYTFKPFTMDAVALHEKFKQDVHAELIKRELTSETERHFQRPTHKKVRNAALFFRKPDITVNNRVTVEIKVGATSYLDSPQNLTSFEAICREVYPPLKGRIW